MQRNASYITPKSHNKVSDAGANLPSISLLNSLLPFPFLFQQKQSLYASADEFRSFIEEVLAWDIRSLSQRSRPHSVDMRSEDHGSYGDLEEDDQDERLCDLSRDSHADVIYHLLLEGIDVSYRIDEKCNVVVEKATLVCNVGDRSSRGYFMWRDKLEQKN